MMTYFCSFSYITLVNVGDSISWYMYFVSIWLSISDEKLEYSDWAKSFWLLDSFL